LPYRPIYIGMLIHQLSSTYNLPVQRQTQLQKHEIIHITFKIIHHKTHPPLLITCRNTKYLLATKTCHPRKLLTAKQIAYQHYKTKKECSTETLHQIKVNEDKRLCQVCTILRNNNEALRLSDRIYKTTSISMAILARDKNEAHSDTYVHTLQKKYYVYSRRVHHRKC